MNVARDYIFSNRNHQYSKHLSRLPRLDPTPNHKGSLPVRANSKACMYTTHLYAPSLQVQLPVLATHNAHIHIVIM